MSLSFILGLLFGTVASAMLVVLSAGDKKE